MAGGRREGEGKGKWQFPIMVAMCLLQIQGSKWISTEGREDKKREGKRRGGKLIHFEPWI